MTIPESRDHFKASLINLELSELVEAFIFGDSVHALPTTQLYAAFRAKVQAALPSAEYIAVVGSGNWRFSLNPEKLLNEYHERSDIDVAVVSEALYVQTWSLIRSAHRVHWYALSGEVRSRLLRNGQNIYSGFVCPTWLPLRGHPAVYEFKRMLNRLSGPEVGYRDIKMYYFKDRTEMLDYYQRGFRAAKRELQV